MKKTLLVAACLAAFVASGAYASEPAKVHKKDTHVATAAKDAVVAKKTTAKKDAKAAVKTAANKTDKSKTVKKN